MFPNRIQCIVVLLNIILEYAKICFLFVLGIFLGLDFLLLIHATRKAILTYGATYTFAPC